MPENDVQNSSRAPVIVWAALLVAVLIGLVAAVSGGNIRLAPSMGLVLPVPVGPAGFTTAGSPPGAFRSSIPAAGVDTVDVDGITGQVDIIATSASAVGDAGSSRALLYRFDASTHVLYLSCSDTAGCPAALYTLTIPEHMGLTLREVSGHSVLTGISGPVDITASCVDATATELDVPSFTAAITSGHLDASFSGVPPDVRLTVVSAQATLHLPGSSQYAVSQHTVSGDADVSVPQDSNSPDTVDLSITSGQVTVVDN
jgi:hypothetical protein